jgi:hypothetical protein
MAKSTISKPLPFRIYPLERYATDAANLVLRIGVTCVHGLTKLRHLGMAFFQVLDGEAGHRKG